MGLAIDAAIVALYFLSITAIGLYMGRREGSFEEFALGGRRMPWWAVMASIVAAETSAATFLGVPTEGFSKRSLAYMQLAYGIILGRVVVGYFFLKPFYDLKVYTVYDYLEVRFGPMTKGYVSVLFLVMRTLASGTRLFIPALVMVWAWKMIMGGNAAPYGHGAAGTVNEYLLAIIAMTIITCAYTAIGGIKAVIWTDVIQATLMIGCAVVAIATLLYHIGGDHWNLLDGIREVGRKVPELRQVKGYVLTGFEKEHVDAWRATNHITGPMGWWNRIKMILADTYALPTAIIGYTVMCVGAFGTDQDMVQRMLTAPDYKKSRRSLITAGLMDLPIFTAFALIGVLLWVFYQQRPSIKPSAPADVFGAYILNVMPVGIRGLVLAGIFATAMGSLSAALNALATTVTNDWYIKWVGKDKPEKHYVLVARVCTGIFAVCMIGVAWGFAYANVNMPGLRIIPVVLGVAGLILGPMLGVFLIGMFTTRGSDQGNVIAITAGLFGVLFVGGFWIDLFNLLGKGGWTRPTWLPEVSFTWYSVVGSAVVCGVGCWFGASKDRMSTNTMERGPDCSGPLDN
ncbi:MAG TPA: sodium:solute symporter [Tepidisphaeraceae bacterium]|jgi:SSS family transporter|nr:sodium:solute symporter [Tepidisphaeraceae bacterium]